MRNERLDFNRGGFRAIVQSVGLGRRAFCEKQSSFITRDLGDTRLGKVIHKDTTSIPQTRNGTTSSAVNSGPTMEELNMKNYTLWTRTFPLNE
jgi:hypothetical protein